MAAQHNNRVRPKPAWVATTSVWRPAGCSPCIVAHVTWYIIVCYRNTSSSSAASLPKNDEACIDSPSACLRTI